jgi:hypothetical protein
MRYTTYHVGLAGLLLASACTGTINGGGSDDDPGTPSTNVQVIVRDGTSPQANVRVLFQNADDSLLAEAVTDATGLAGAQMPVGGNVTVIRTFADVPPPDLPPPAEVYTYVGVKPGDRLVLGHPVSDATPSAINVTVPDGAQGTIKIVTPCGAGQGTAPIVAITVRDCPVDVDFFVTTGDQSTFFKRAPYGANVDLGSEPLLGSLAATLASTNVPAGATVNVEERVVAGAFELFSSGSKRVDAQPATVNLPNLQGVDQLVVATIKAPNNAGTQMVAERSTYSASPVIVDAAGGLVPLVSAPKYEPTGISWVEQGPGDADAVVVTLNVTRGAAMGGTPARDAEYVHAIIAPHAGMTLRMPVLPGADAMYNLSMADDVAGTQGLVKATGGYDAIRGNAFAVTNVVEAAAADTTVTLSYAGNTPPGL